MGFGCPVPGCGSPYLTWHHFDPPWAVKEHHDPAGMIALCRDHHPEADGGAFTVDDLRRFKQEGRQQTASIGGRFNWMREQLLVRLGGMFYYQTPIALQIGTNPVVWFNRDPSNRILLNLTMLTTSGEPRLAMRDNFWVTEGANIKAIKCPPSGKLVTVRYQNDDRLRVEFREVQSAQQLDRRYPVRAHKQPKWARDLPGGGVSSTPTPNSVSCCQRWDHLSGCGRRDYDASDRLAPAFRPKQDDDWRRHVPGWVDRQLWRRSADRLMPPPSTTRTPAARKPYTLSGATHSATIARASVSTPTKMSPKRKLHRRCQDLESACESGRERRNPSRPPQFAGRRDPFV